MDKNLIQELKEKLEKEKGILEKELNSFAKKDDKLKGDWDTRFPEFNGGPLEEAADEVVEYEARLPIEHTLELKLRDVNLALEKIRTSLPARTLNAPHILRKELLENVKNAAKKFPKKGWKLIPEPGSVLIVKDRLK